MQRVHVVVVDRALGGTKRLGGDLPAEETEPVGRLVSTAEDVGVDPFEIEDVEQFVESLAHAPARYGVARVVTPLGAAAK